MKLKPEKEGKSAFVILVLAISSVGALFCIFLSYTKLEFEPWKRIALIVLGAFFAISAGWSVWWMLKHEGKMFVIDTTEEDSRT